MKEKKNTTRTRKPKAEVYTSESFRSNVTEVTAEIKSALGIELSEKTVETLAVLKADPNTPPCDTFAHMKEGNEVCAACSKDFPERNTACKAASSKGSKAKKSTVVTRVGKYGTLAELKAAIAVLSSATSEIDKMALEGSYTLKAMLEKANDLRKTKHTDWNDMKTVSKIKNHLEYRCTRGWVISIGSDGVVKVVDFNGKSNKLSVVEKAAEKAEEKAEAAPEVKAA